MKSTFLLLTALLTFGAIKAQTITAAEMIAKTKCKNFDCFDDFITGKGFKFLSYSEGTFSHMYLFTSDEYVENGNAAIKTKNTCSINIGKDNGKTGVGLRTPNKLHYKKLLTGFKTEKFKATETKSYTRGIGVETSYSSPKYPNLYLVVFVVTMTKDGIEWIDYDFELQKL